MVGGFFGMDLCKPNISYEDEITPTGTAELHGIHLLAYGHFSISAGQHGDLDR